MNLPAHIKEAVAAFPKIVTPEVVSAASAALGVSATEFCDLFAKEVAREYLAGELSWSDADCAMNALSGFFFVHLPAAAPFPDYAFAVFQAFDAGEIVAEPENERIAREQLASLHEKA
jgi:hypothetical protein